MIRDEVGPDARYRRSLAEGRFELQQCDDCARYVFAPRVLCPACGGGDLTWRPVSGQGTVYSTTVSRDRSGDANIVLVDLDEGPRMMSTVDGVAPDEVRIGMAVRARIEDIGGAPVIVFRPQDLDG